MKKGNFWGLLPLLFFVITYFAGSFLLGDFYALPILVVFLLALFVALLQYPKRSFGEKLSNFVKGAGDENILVMVLIFLLAGAFGALTKDIGSIASTINFALSFVSPQYIVACLFLISCFVSLSLGTSVATVAALAPVAIGLEDVLPGTMSIALAAVVGGAMFGDNLSFISDTTIAATRTQDIAMAEKFKVNFKMVLPVALLVTIIYGIQGSSLLTSGETLPMGAYDPIKIMPYLMVFVLAFAGVNVIWALGLGVLCASFIGLATGSIDFLGVLASINDGFIGMFELSILCLIIGGVIGVIRMNGGIDYLLAVVTERIRSKKRAELGIAFLVASVNLAIANNTIAIVIVGPIAKKIADQNDLKGNRVASILDTVSCFVQGIVPYGAQLLAALAAANLYLADQQLDLLSPLSIMQYLYYPFLTGLVTLLVIIFGRNGQSAIAR